MDNNIIIPKHIGIIMDGNGRWAKKRLLPRNMGHKKGAEVLRSQTEPCGHLRQPHRLCAGFVHADHYSSGVCFEYLSVVGDHNDSCAFLAVDSCEKLHNAVCSLVVEVSGGLVRYYYLRIIQERTCNCDSLLFSS